MYVLILDIKRYAYVLPKSRAASPGSAEERFDLYALRDSSPDLPSGLDLVRALRRPPLEVLRPLEQPLQPLPRPRPFPMDVEAPVGALNTNPPVIPNASWMSISSDEEDDDEENIPARGAAPTSNGPNVILDFQKQVQSTAGFFRLVSTSPLDLAKLLLWAVANCHDSEQTAFSRPTHSKCPLPVTEKMFLVHPEMLQFVVYVEHVPFTTELHSPLPQIRTQRHEVGE